VPGRLRRLALSGVDAPDSILTGVVLDRGKRVVPLGTERLQDRLSGGRSGDLGVVTFADALDVVVAVARRMKAPPVRTWNIACLIMALRAFASAMTASSVFFGRVMRRILSSPDR